LKSKKSGIGKIGCQVCEFAIPSALSRRHDAARRKLRADSSISKLASKIIQKYQSDE
jgi:hypothetical protein